MQEMKSTSNLKYAVLVLSCDKNSDLWPTFFQLFFKYWEDRLPKVYLGTNFAKFYDDRVTTVNSKLIDNWSTELDIILEQISEDYVLMILEDYFIYKRVNVDSVELALNSMNTRNACFFRLACFPKKYNLLWPSTIVDQENKIFELNLNSEYLLNLQIGIWKKSVLKDLLVLGESPWQFEINASNRYRKLSFKTLAFQETPGINYVHGPITYLSGALTKGVIMRDSIRLCKRENVSFEPFPNRKVETSFEEAVRIFYISLPIKLRKVFDFLNKKLNLLFRKMK